jgi:DNA mismatch repair ATPase MutS
MYELLYSHYRKRLKDTASDLTSVKKQIYLLGSLRLCSFIATIGFAIFLRAQGSGTVFLVLLSGIVLFLALLRKYNCLQKRKHYLETSIRCDENELKGLDYDFSAFDGAAEKIDASHPFSLDLDIFGTQSLFQSINRTCTNYGKKILTGWFENPLQAATPIQNRQEAVKELKDKDVFLHHYRILGITNPGNESDYKEIEDFVHSPDYFTSRKTRKIFAFLLPVLWIILIGGAVLNLWSFPVLSIAYIAALLFSEIPAQKINRLQCTVGKKIAILHACSGLIETIENEKFQSQTLTKLHSYFFKDNQKASSRFKKLVQLAGELEQRSNLLIHLFLNPLLLWDIRKSIQIEEWKEKNGKDLILWIKVLGEFDAYCSLGIFSFNHPDAVFPAFTDTYFEIKGKALRHPLMNRETFVKNDIHIEKHPFFRIITGANMAGKSTYLRTVGVNFVLACIGSPVCAESLTLYPASLVTSLRTSDSLLENESYFFAELKRLKMIIDRLQAGEKLFIVLDEILKGTNSADKQKGSLALIQQFVRLQSCGIIATHDLHLGSLEKEFPSNIKNYCFEADIENDKLTFSYRQREGIAQNMNACFLMQQMGITLLPASSSRASATHNS